MSRLLYPRHRFAERTFIDLEDLLQQLVQLTGCDAAEQEKCYDVNDKTLSFVDGDDDMDCK